MLSDPTTIVSAGLFRNKANYSFSKQKLAPLSSKSGRVQLAFSLAQNLHDRLADVTNFRRPSGQPTRL
jgi:hypothetical protein